MNDMSNEIEYLRAKYGGLESADEFYGDTERKKFMIHIYGIRNEEKDKEANNCIENTDIQICKANYTLLKNYSKEELESNNEIDQKIDKGKQNELQEIRHNNKGKHKIIYICLHVYINIFMSFIMLGRS